jgi:uncharacterized RDD family membrane protein YckC
MKDNETLRPAAFSERLLAFAADSSPFIGAWILTLRLLDPASPVTAHPQGAAAALIWGGLFLAHQAYFSSEGRVTFGKRLFGLRVIGFDGEPLSLAHGLGRSLGYLVSQIFTAGFLWALIDPKGRALHDLPFGTLVVAQRPLGASRGVAVRFAAASLIVAFAGLYTWENVWAPRYEKAMTVVYARHALREYVVLQKAYKAEHGRYAENMFALATMSIDPRAFLRDAVALYDQGAVSIVADRDHFAIAARANDVDKTLVAVSGP